MAEDSEQEKYYRELREERAEKRRRAQEKEAEKKTQQLNKWYEEGQNIEKEKKKSTLSGFINSGFSSLWNKISEAFTSGDFKKIVFLPLTLIGEIFKIISAFFKYTRIGKIISYVVIVLLVFATWSFFWNLLTGGGVSIFGTQLSILGSETSGPVSVAISQVKNFVLDPVGTVASYGTFKNPQTVEKKKPQGVEFRKFEPKKDIFREKDKIEALAAVKIYALEDLSTNVEFSCTKGDVVQQITTIGFSGSEGGEIKLFGENEGSNSVFVYPNQDKSLNILCSFGEETLYAIKFGDKKTISQKITLKANYKDFIVSSRLKIYTLDSTILTSLEQDNKNPFAYFKINDPLISSDRSVRSEQLKKSPAILSLNLFDAQPLRDSAVYLLGLEIKNDKFSWNGKISSLKSLRVSLPNGFKPKIEDCKEFDLIENNVLKLKEDIILKLNKDKDVSDQRFFCEFEIDNSAVTEDLSFSLIEAEAKFDYEFQAFTSAIISKNLLSPTTT